MTRIPILDVGVEGDWRDVFTGPAFSLAQGNFNKARSHHRKRLKITFHVYMKNVNGCIHKYNDLGEVNNNVMEDAVPAILFMATGQRIALGFLALVGIPIYIIDVA
jgi:hypothetical protein